MIRIGFGKDIHKLVQGRKLILAGIEIPFDKGEEAHSDGDVVFHALGEALLGSLALGDLGKHFPPSDDKWKNCDSSIILLECYNKVKKNGFLINNIDISIEIEQPHLSKYVDQMAKNIADLLTLELDQVSIKAMSNEGLDATGRGEAVIAYASILVTNEII